MNVEFVFDHNSCTCEHDPEDHGTGCSHCYVEDCECEANWEEVGYG